jgi:Recombination endonuclease VII
MSIRQSAKQLAAARGISLEAARSRLRRGSPDLKARGRKKARLSHEEYYDLLWRQQGQCKICGRRAGPRRLAIDHDHKTGRIRGLLCVRCNVGLGQFGDDPYNLQAAIFYLGHDPVTLDPVTQTPPPPTMIDETIYEI